VIASAYVAAPVLASRCR